MFHMPMPCASLLIVCYFVHVSVRACACDCVTCLCKTSTNLSHAQARKQAASLLIAAFPLQNPEAPQRETDELMQAQFEKLQVCNKPPL